jgi:hypothetical protein
MTHYTYYTLNTGEIISVYSTNTESVPIIYNVNIGLIEGAYDYLQYYIKNGIPVAYTDEQAQLKKQRPFNNPLTVWSNETFTWVDL